MVKYIIGVLAALAILFGVISYKQYGEVQKLTGEVSTYKEASEENLRAKEDADSSCRITIESLEASFKEQIELERGKTATHGKIDALPTITIKEKRNAAPTQSQNYSDDDRLSRDIMLLLDEAYCYGDKDGCAKAPR